MRYVDRSPVYRLPAGLPVTSRSEKSDRYRSHLWFDQLTIHEFVINTIDLKNGVETLYLRFRYTLKKDFFGT